MTLPLAGLLVVSVEQAVAAPQCTCRLADAGARVIKVERPDGDFSRHYDHVVHGESAHFVWLNRGKESVVLDLVRDEDKALLEAMLAKADVFVQNLKPGALAKLGFAFARLRKDYPRLICCSISGYGESGPYAQRKAYDLLIQAESGVSSVTGGPEAPARVGVSIVDIAAGLSAYETILEALIARGRSGEGAAISISMFDAMAEWMTIPLLNEEYGNPFKRVGLAHPTIAPYRAYQTRDGADILIAVQNDREWRVLADKVLGDVSLGHDPKFATVTKRVEHRAQTDAAVAKVFAAHDAEPLMKKLEAADIAFARVNGSALLSKHPHLRRISVDAPSGPASIPAPTPQWAGKTRAYGPVPALGAHTAKVRKEFGGG
ncbi:MAG TPA: CaiB/BaiF CoA-transferase family protein [Pseudolabrys sp.]|nr:CaiB/BaiF CoA-transferase family protein [Pseudolabrys sp.]